MGKIVFTNGCFDLLHPGHVDLLERARALGDKLIVGINSDASVNAIKGGSRPYINQEDRKKLLLGLSAVDQVIIFNELTPDSLIREIRPNILVKGGDWKPSEIIGADFVESMGGKVYSLPFLNGYSSSEIVNKILNSQISKDDASEDDFGLREHLEVFKKLLDTQLNSIESCGKLISDVFAGGNKILLCGNGGSAADAQHIAAEFVGRYEKERKALPAIALTTDTSALTALANDYSFDRVFARQVEALANQNDCLIAISTSGDSPNVISAVMTARKLGCRIIGMTGQNGKKLASLCDAVLMVPSSRTARIQEAHIAVAHYWCEMLDRNSNEPA